MNAKGITTVHFRGIADVPMASAGRLELRCGPAASWLLCRAQSPQCQKSTFEGRGACSGSQPVLEFLTSSAVPEIVPYLGRRPIRLALALSTRHAQKRRVSQNALQTPPRVSHLRESFPVVQEALVAGQRWLRATWSSGCWILSPSSHTHQTPDAPCPGGPLDTSLVPFTEGLA